MTAVKVPVCKAGSLYVREMQVDDVGYVRFETVFCDANRTAYIRLDASVEEEPSEERPVQVTRKEDGYHVDLLNHPGRVRRYVSWPGFPSSRLRSLSGVAC